jgi:hypothetical protein
MCVEIYAYLNMTYEAIDDEPGTVSSAVYTDKTSYNAGEIIKISVKSELSSFRRQVKGVLSITDENNVLISKIDSDINENMIVGIPINYNNQWKVDDLIAGTYKVKIDWYDNEEKVGGGEREFEILPKGGISNQVTTDKAEYSPNENVNITEIIRNTSSNSILRDLTINTAITNAEGTAIWSQSNSINEILQNGNLVLKNLWNTSNNAPGDYTVTSDVYKNEIRLSENSITFKISSEVEGITSVSGDLEILNKDIFTKDGVNIKYTINNTSNVKLDDITARVRIVDVSTGTVVGTLSDQTSIDVSSSFTAERTWTHEPLKAGEYMVVLDALHSDGKEVSLASSYLNVKRNKIISSEAFKYTLFSGSTYDPLCMYVNQSVVNGQVRTNKSFEFSGTSLVINGLCSSFGSINAWGSTIKINEKQEDPTVIEMPDAINDIKEIASVNANVTSGNFMVTDYGKGIEFSTSQISSGSLQVNGTSLTSKGYMVADGNISFNLSSLMASNNEQGIVICSGGGDISFNASNVDLKGVIYAPNGTVYINVNTFKLTGRIIAKRIVINCSDFSASSTQDDLNLLDITLQR